MSTYENETVRRKPVGTLKLLAAIGLIAFTTNLLVQLLNLLPSGSNKAISMAVLIVAFGFVWKLIAHNIESFTYKITEDQGLLVIERKLGRSSTSFFSLKLIDVLEIRDYIAAEDRKIPGKRRFTVSRKKASWRAVTFVGADLKNDKLLLEPSSNFIESLNTRIAQEKVKS